MARVYLTKEEEQYNRLLRNIRGSVKSIAALSRVTGIERTRLGKKLDGKGALTVPELIKIQNAIGEVIWI